MIQHERLIQLIRDAETARAHSTLKVLQVQLLTQRAIQQMNAPLLDTAAAINAQRSEICSICDGKAYALVGIHYLCWRCQSAGQWAHLRAAERKENKKALKAWLAVMTAASFAGWLIWQIAYLAK